MIKYWKKYYIFLIIGLVFICIIIFYGLQYAPDGGRVYQYWWPFRSQRYININPEPSSEAQVKELLEQVDKLGWDCEICRLAAHGDFEKVKELVDAGHVNDQEGTDWTALDWAKAVNREDIADYLRKKGGLSGDDINKRKKHK